jgi:hypothetical protein
MATSAPPDRLSPTDPAALVAILIAARKLKDGLLEEIATEELRERHQILISFEKPRKTPTSPPSPKNANLIGGAK